MLCKERVAKMARFALSNRAGPYSAPSSPDIKVIPICERQATFWKWNDTKQRIFIPIRESQRRNSHVKGCLLRPFDVQPLKYVFIFQ